MLFVSGLKNNNNDIRRNLTSKSTLCPPSTLYGVDVSDDKYPSVEDWRSDFYGDKDDDDDE
ncbi:MAG: hypothetical protein ACOX3T_07155 [Bdellovibrionota bacterium]